MTLAIRNLKTLYIGASTFMLRAHGEGTRHANMQQALASRPYRFQNHTIAARTNTIDTKVGRGAVDVAKDAGGFDEMFVGSQDQIIDLMINGGFDVVRIATPDAFHSVYAIEALTNGIHVICEKGLSHNLADGVRMVEAAKQAQNGAAAVLEYNYNGMDAFAKIRELIETGRVIYGSKWYAAVIRFLQDWGINDRSNWRFKHELCGLTGVLGDLGTHIIRAILFCLESLGDEVVAVEGTTTYYDGFGDNLRLLDAQEVDHENLAVDAATFVLIMKSGARITGETGRHYRISKADMGLEIFGAGGKLQWQLSNQPVFKFSEHKDVPGDEQGEKSVHVHDFVPGLSAGFHTGHGNIDLAFLRWLEEGQQGPCPGTTFEQGLHCLRIAEAIRQAGIEHNRVELANVV